MNKFRLLFIFIFSFIFSCDNLIKKEEIIIVENFLSQELKLSKWHEDEITVYINSSLYESEPDNFDIVLDSFQVWRDANPKIPRVTFKKSIGQFHFGIADGINTVSLGQLPFKENQNYLGVTVAFTDPRNGYMKEVDIIINDNFMFKKNIENKTDENAISCHQINFYASNCGYSYDFKTILIHEIGHFWGLPDTMIDPSATMFGCVSLCETHKRTLSDSDIYLLNKMYK